MGMGCPGFVGPLFYKFPTDGGKTNPVAAGLWCFASCPILWGRTRAGAQEELNNELQISEQINGK